MAGFVWHELNTTDPKAAATFYGSVVGWKTTPFEGGGDYQMLMAGDRPAGGLMSLPEPARAAGPRWANYLGVADVDAEAAAVRAAGGAVHVGPQDIPDVGRFAAVSDPMGAVFMMLTPLPREMPPPVAVGTPGHAVWHELHTTDWPAAFAFYAERFGWEKSMTVDMGPMGTYQTFSADGVQVGGMMNSPVPHPMWLTYFAVDDIDAGKQAIEANGGAVLHGPMEIPGGGFSLQARDPQGAMFGIVGKRKG